MAQLTKRQLFIQEELKNVQAAVKNIPSAHLIACVPMQVRIKIARTKHKEVTVMIQFPDSYPNGTLLVEIKSGVFGFKFLDGLSKLCEQESRKNEGREQVVPVIKFVNRFLDENPLCVISDEISAIKRDLMTEEDELKLKQKESKVALKITQGAYFFHLRFLVPDKYYSDQLKVELVEQNFPDVIRQNLLGNAIEITRKCIQPPVKKKPKDPPFEPKPSLKLAADYLFKYVKRYPSETCPLCNQRSLPDDPKDVITDPEHDHYIERVYCTHLFHHKCLTVYFKTPPFEGGKKCPSCNLRIYHEKWKVTPQLAESRWAHQQARERELDEVVDFLQ